jgi:hypothetical protein
MIKLVTNSFFFGSFINLLNQCCNISVYFNALRLFFLLIKAYSLSRAGGCFFYNSYHHIHYFIIFISPWGGAIRSPCGRSTRPYC